jgi:hypothetical protein
MLCRAWGLAPPPPKPGLPPNTLPPGLPPSPPKPRPPSNPLGLAIPLLLMLLAGSLCAAAAALMLCVWCSSSPRLARLPDMLRPSDAESEEGSRADSAAADLRAAISAARAVGAPLYTRVVRTSPLSKKMGAGRVGGDGGRRGGERERGVSNRIHGSGRCGKYGMMWCCVGFGGIPVHTCGQGLTCKRKGRSSTRG